MTRGQPTGVTRWYNIAQNQSITSTIKYDECGNAREATDPRSYVTTTEFWLSSADNAYAFPLHVTNAKGQVTSASFSYKSGALLSQTDANGKVTSTTYDSLDRPTQITKPEGISKTFTYIQDPEYRNPPRAIIRQYLD